jgi:transcriptional regulator with XRE-family HTH domain
VSDPLRSALRHRLGAQLRVIRRRARLSGRELAERIGVSQSKVSRIEIGELWPPLADIAAWLDACYTDQAERTRVMALAEAIEHGLTTLRDVHPGSLEVRQAELVDLDARATQIRQFAPLILPALLQPAGYALAVATAANLRGERDVNAAVRTQMDRAEQLRKTGPAYHAVITEAALRWRPAGNVEPDPEVLRHILDVARLDRVTVQVIPAGTPTTMVPTGGFTLHELSADPPLAIVDTPAAEITFSGDETAAFAVVFERAVHAALPATESTAFIERMVP